MDALKDENIVYVSCGSFHTLAVAANGNIYSFGQNKYGKLGMHYSFLKDGENQKLPVRISQYKYEHNDVKKEVKNDAL